MKQLTQQQIDVLIEALSLATERTYFMRSMAKFRQVYDEYERQDQNLHKFQRLLRELMGE